MSDDYLSESHLSLESPIEEILSALVAPYYPEYGEYH